MYPTGTDIDPLLERTLKEIDAGQHENALRIVLEQTEPRQHLLLYWLAYTIAQSASHTQARSPARDLVASLDSDQTQKLSRACDLAEKLIPVLDLELNNLQGRAHRFEQSPELIRDIAQAHIRSLERAMRVHRVLLDALRQLANPASDSG